MADITRPAPRCPECGGERFWYGSVEFWVGGSSHSADDNLNAAVCGSCGYSSLYLQNMRDFRHALASARIETPASDIADAPGALAASQPPDRAEIKAFRKAVRKQKKAKDRLNRPHPVSAMPAADEGRVSGLTLP